MRPRLAIPGMRRPAVAREPEIHFSVPVPEPGKQHLVLKLDAELVEKAGTLDGRFEDQLVAAVEETIRDFLQRQPQALMFPREGP